MIPVEFNKVWKKFSKGEKIYSLRDFIPSLVKGIFTKTNNEQLKEREFWALKDVSFQVQKGDVLGIIGPNGAGKSTILKLLSMLMKPTHGEMHIRGRFSALIEVTAGFHPEFTGRENIYFNGAVLGMKKKEIDQKYDQIVDFSGVGEFIDTPVKRYSSGMYARLGFAVAAHVDPDVLLVDEVLAVGDMNFQAKCAQKMRELLKRGTTIVLVSHNISLVQSMCKRVILLNRGEVLKAGAPEEAIPHYQNIVFHASEDALKKQVSTSPNYRFEIKNSELVKITSVSLCDRHGQKKENFQTKEFNSIEIHYEAPRRVDNPVFSLRIFRADGVLCCGSNTKDDQVTIERIEGNGTFKITLGEINLAPGVYLLEVSVLDKELIHPYCIRKQDILRIDTSTSETNTHSEVFITPFHWEIRK